MTSLARPLRNALESTVKRGREIAEAAAAEALTYLGVSDPEAPKHLSEDKKAFRVQLRAHARQLGDALDAGKQETRRLAEEVAYEQWHRLLFTRFLVENNLLIHPDLQDAISMADCEELAVELGKDPWQLAGEFASRMLPQIFRPDDPTQRIELPVNRRKELESLVNGLDREAFLAKDALGWSYQFWQAKRKDDINAAGVKIGADEIPAVTQLFTEDYMVEFLLHNSLGAWWVSNFPDQPLPVDMPYLRYVDEEVDDGKGGKKIVRRPAAGAFEGWPTRLNDFTLMDPCCGSGHFPVFALGLLVPMRMALERLTPKEAVDAVLRENIHALEIDARCVEIAVFALALAAWTYPGAEGYRALPDLNIACTGLAVSQSEKNWLQVAGTDARLQAELQALYKLFRNAPILGSLIDPRAELGSSLLVPSFDEIAPLLDAALGDQRSSADAEAAEVAIAAKGLSRAAKLLTQQYSLVTTNPPYLGREGHVAELVEYAERFAPDAAADLATLMIDRCARFLKEGGVASLVLPQNWWVGKAYETFRNRVLRVTQWQLAVVLGEEAWQAFGNRGPNTVLVILERKVPSSTHVFYGLNLGSRPGEAVFTLEKKTLALAGSTVPDERVSTRRLQAVEQAALLRRSGAKISFSEESALPRLALSVISGEGSSTGDGERFSDYFWEVALHDRWIPYLEPGSSHELFADAKQVLRWEDGLGDLARSSAARIQNVELWQRQGILVGRVRGISAGLSFGGAYTKGAVLVCPRDPSELPAILCFLRSQEYEGLVRDLDPRVSAATSVLTDVPFDKAAWQEAARVSFPKGLPGPSSNDPAQLTFHGHPAKAKYPLQVAVARLLGYRWPSETEKALTLDKVARDLVGRCSELVAHADADGIVCIPAVKGESPAGERIVSLLGASFGNEWNSGVEAKLLADAGCPGVTLEAWLRNSFFAQHCKVFHDRPFIWQVWDGQKDGFAALVNYHKLDKARLEALAYAYLGDWIEQQQRRVASNADGAKILLAAALNLQEKLKLILAGETPCDIFVRWKPLEQQPLGWQPDLNDGVRVNIRPFMLCGDVGKKGAGILRDKPNISWKKDRGTDVASAPWFDLGPAYGEEKGARINDHHTTLAEKNKARGAKT